uniref:Uncharacterized protein n=1 Tax=Clytia hemisphaerica TaxID=252671 RepID=A0A7M5V0H0_9CNID
MFDSFENLVFSFGNNIRVTTQKIVTKGFITTLKQLLGYVLRGELGSTFEEVPTSFEGVPGLFSQLRRRCLLLGIMGGAAAPTWALLWTVKREAATSGATS